MCTIDQNKNTLNVPQNLCKLPSRCTSSLSRMSHKIKPYKCSHMSSCRHVHRSRFKLDSLGNFVSLSFGQIAREQNYQNPKCKNRNMCSNHKQIQILHRQASCKAPTLVFTKNRRNHFFFSSYKARLERNKFTN